VAQALQTTGEIANNLGLVEVVEVRLPEVLVVHALGEHVVDRNKDLVTASDGSALIPPPRLESVELVLEVSRCALTERRSTRAPLPW
jgi:hypothetical protein